MVRGTGTAGIRAAAAAASRNVKTESPEEPDISDENDYDEEDEDDDQTHGIASVAGGPRRASVAGNGSSSSARGPMEIRDGKKFRCSLCSETFGRVYELRRHQAIHTDNRAFVCDKCGSGFAWVFFGVGRIWLTGPDLPSRLSSWFPCCRPEPNFPSTQPKRRPHSSRSVFARSMRAQVKQRRAQIQDCQGQGSCQGK